MSGEDSGSSDDDYKCSCMHCTSSPGRSKLDEDFTLGFRPGLILDDHHAASSEIPSSHSSGQHTEDRHSGVSSKAAAASSSTGNSETRKLKRRVKRKRMDGHVHWADEFQKDLTRCHPRKSYNRHPPHHTPSVKPILKVSHEDCEMMEQY